MKEITDSGVFLTMLSAVIRRQHFHDVFECRRKLALAFVPYGSGDRGDAVRCITEQLGGTADAVLLHIGGDRHAVYGFKQGF